MATEYSGRGDPRRSLDLLWGGGPRPARGPKPGLDVGAVVGAAIELADADGLDGLSMRRVAERLRVGTMSLYTYVPSKAELLDLMLDHVYGEQASAIRAATTGDPSDPAAEVRVGWRDGLRAVAASAWDLYHRHRWILQMAHARSVLGPNELRVFDASLRIVDGLGLSGREMVAIVDLVAVYVGGAARGAVEALQAPGATGQTDDEWWLERERILGEKMGDGTAFPTVTRVSEAGGFDVADDAVSYTLAFALDDYQYGLDVVLDGIQHRIEAHAGAGR
jgi:AcrR family transcriptional regulator